MADREKVIVALEKCAIFMKFRDRPWDKCDGIEHDVPRNLLLDALELLKWQAKVMPNSTIEQNVAGGLWWFSCGNCGEQIDYKDKFCRHCGRAVKWD